MTRLPSGTGRFLAPTALTRETRTRNACTRNTRARQARGRRGFTLVSMIVALVLLGVGVGALAHSSAETLKYQNIAQNKTNAIAIARTYVETLRTQDPWVMQTEPSVAVDQDGTLSNSGKYSRAMDLAVERQNLVRLTITVNYPRMTDPVVLTTFLYRGNGLAGMGS
ncbi:MAG: prepilin-type N-terminal cleavage/methylation domain-containing protein [Gemmatimonadaceae bacterium]